MLLKETSEFFVCASCYSIPMATNPKSCDEESKSDPVILITGATGYVGHHLLNSVLESFPCSIVHATHRSQDPMIISDRVQYFKIDFSDDQSVDTAVSAIFTSCYIPDIIVHCAAATKPGFCQKNEAKAMRINCPQHFIQCLLSHYKGHESTECQRDQNPLFIFFSTDLVYDGELADPNSIGHAPMFGDGDSEQKYNETKQRRFYTEQSPCYPLNHYGKSKLEMEEYLLMHWFTGSVVILRSSNIYGPPVGKRGTLLQFVISQLSNQQIDKVILFKNETRNFVCIRSVVKAVEHLIIQYWSNGKEYHCVYNCGGIQKLNRVEFGLIIGKLYGLDTSKIRGISRFECTEEWAHQAPNPQDVSMSSNKLHVDMEDFYTFPSVEDNLKQIKAETM